MAAHQEDVANLNRLIDKIMLDNVEAVEEIQTETQPEEDRNFEKGNQLEEEEQPEKEITEEEKDFISQEAKELWNKVISDKEFLCERGFGKLISPFSKVMKKRGWEFFCEHKGPGFAALVREFYANMVGMKDDSMYVRGVWVPFSDRRINEVFKLRDFKHGSKYKKLLENPNYEKIVSRLTGGEGKWEVPDSVLPEAEEEPLRVSPTYPLFPKVQEQVPAQAEGSKSREENTEIMELLRPMKREMEERELKWERQQRIKEEFMEAAARRKEHIWEEKWRIREEEHKEELKRQEKNMIGRIKTSM